MNIKLEYQDSAVNRKLRSRVKTVLVALRICEDLLYINLIFIVRTYQEFSTCLRAFFFRGSSRRLANKVLAPIPIIV